MSARRRRLIASLACTTGMLAVAGITAAALAAPTAPTNRAAAQVDAAHSLAALRLPPGAIPSPTEPAGDHGDLSRPGYPTSLHNLIDDHAWWTIPKSPGQVLDYVTARLPRAARQFEQFSGSSSYADLYGYQGENFTLPPIPGVLGDRALAVTVAQLNATTTAIRTDGEAVWILPRPAWDRIPPSPSRVTFVAQNETTPGHPGPPSAPRTLAGDSAHRLATFIDQLERVQPGAGFTSCFAAYATDAVRLTFYSSSGHMIARALETTGCGANVQLRVGGRTGPRLLDDPSVTEELERLGAIPMCSRSQLAATASPTTANGSGRSMYFTFTNVSDSACHLSGFPHVQLFDTQGHAMRVKPLDEGAKSVRRAGLAAAVALAPRQAESVVVGFTACRTARAVRALLTLPGVPGSFSLSVGSKRRPVDPCGGRLSIGIAHDRQVGV